MLQQITYPSHARTPLLHRKWRAAPFDGWGLMEILFLCSSRYVIYFFVLIQGVKATFSMMHRAPCEPDGFSRSQISRRGKSEPFSGLPRFMEEFL